MAKSEPKLDVLVLGEHPAAYLAAALLRFKSKLAVTHATIPSEHVPDRLVVVNPEFFDLHPLVEGLRRKLELNPIYGARFLGNDPATASEFRSKAAVVSVGSYKDIRNAVMKVAEEQDVELLTPKVLHVHRLDEGGLDITLGKHEVRPKVIVLAGKLAADQERMLGMPEAWGPDIVHRYTFVKIKGSKGVELGNRPILPMSLDLNNMLTWAWLLAGKQYTQLAVEQPVESLGAVPAKTLLAGWVEVLRKHGVLGADARVALEAAEYMDLPLAGALAHEGLANRTLLVGPAGGFYSACSEDIYPNCWSAVFAADAIKKGLKELHLQDALQPYRHKWRTTLGDYLRGPQQNLRFLLPLVYRNQVMTNRLAESILLGKSVVR
ncbi:MAG TPA: hypothetical protein VIL86_10975 [Tepidisphaeraceae bacterium]|jgi:hypothetical protein